MRILNSLHVPDKVEHFLAYAVLASLPTIHERTEFIIAAAIGYLRVYVMLLNHACCSPGWPQEGVYLSFNANLSDPSGWTDPQPIVSGGFWYPQIIGIAPGDTDHVAGQAARFYMYGHSDAVIVFSRPPGRNVAEP